MLTSIYNIQASEIEITQNMLSVFEEYQQYYKTVSEKFDAWVPELREKIKYSKKTAVYGVDLARHVRYNLHLEFKKMKDFNLYIFFFIYSLRNQKIAFPIELGCEFLKLNLKNEGIFRLC